MIKRLCLLPVLALMGCATLPQFGDADRAALKPDIAAYHDCLNRETAQMINGSGDVELLTRVILRDCDDKLQPIADYLQTRGFTSPFVSNYVQSVRYDAGSTVESYILHAKSMNATPRNGSGDAGQDASPAPSPDQGNVE